MKKFFEDFKKFISRGSVLDLAVGLIIGTAFTAIVKSLVNDVLMPIISLVGGKEIGEWKAVLKQATVIDPATNLPVDASVYLYYGNFIQAIIDFLLIAFTLFIIIKVVMSISERREALKKKLNKEQPQPEPAPAPAPAPSEEVVLLTEIRDALKKKE